MASGRVPKMVMIFILRKTFHSLTRKYCLVYNYVRKVEYNLKNMVFDL